MSEEEESDEEKEEDEFEEKTKGFDLPKKLGKKRKDDANEDVG